MAIQKITASVLGNNAVTAANVAAGALSAADIADNSLTAAKLSTSTFAIDSLTVNTSDLVVDTANNRVGIGTSSPTSGIKLDVRGNVRIGDGSSTEQDIHFHNSNTEWQVGVNNGGNGTDSNQFYFYEGGNYRLTVQKGGKVGIGTTSPNDLFHVYGNDSSTYITNQRSSTKWSEWHVGGTNHYLLWDSTADMRFGTETALSGVGASEKMRITSDGKVGIGSIDPANLLHVSKNTTASGWGDYPTVQIDNPNAAGYASLVFTQGSTASDIKFRIELDNTNDILRICEGGGGNDGIILANSGNVGIGDTTPDYNLHVSGTTGVGITNGGGLRLLPTDASDTDAWIMYQYTDDTLRYNFTGAGADEIIIKYPNATNATTLLIDTEQKRVGIGTDSPSTGLHVKADASSTGAITTTLERTDSASSWLRLKGNSTNSFQLGSTTGGIEFYDDASSTYVAKINNSTNDHNLQKYCYAEFDVFDNSSADAWEEKANLAANVYSLYGAVINPGKYGNNLYYVGVGRENVSEAYVEFKVDLVEARSIYAYFGVSNSADGSTRYARLWYSYDGEIYTQVDNNSFGAGGGSASYTLNLTSVLHHGDGDFTGSVYFRCGLMDNASTHSTLIGWTDFKFKAFAESMTFDGRYKRGSSSTSLVNNTGGGQETNYVPKVPYVHTFTLTSTGASAIETNNGGNGQFTSAGHSYLNKEIFQIVSSPTHGIQCLTEGTIFYTVHQDLKTTGTTSYARVYVQRVTSSASASINVGQHLTTNTGNEWDSISGQGAFDVVPGDIIRFNYSATGINSMDAGSWSYYTLMMIPHTTSAKGNAQGNSNFPFAGGI